MSERESNFGFAVSHDAPIPYLQRIRDYYQALGYGAPYEWAHYSEVPFRRLDKPLSEGRVTIITTAAPYQPDKGDQGPGARYNAAAKFYSVYITNMPEYGTGGTSAPDEQFLYNAIIFPATG